MDSKVPSDDEALTPATAESGSSEEYTFTTSAQEPQITKPIFQAKIMDTPIRKMAESGATVDILSKKDFDGLKEKPQHLPPGVPDFLKDFHRLLYGMGEYKGEPVRIHVD